MFQKCFAVLLLFFGASCDSNLNINSSGELCIAGEPDCPLTVEGEHFTEDPGPPVINPSATHFTTRESFKVDLNPGDDRAVAVKWEKVSGPGDVTFGEDGTFTASTDGSYVIKVTLTDAAGKSTSEIFYVAWDTTPPSVELGDDVVVSIPTVLNPTVTGNDIASYRWEVVSKPSGATVAFSKNDVENPTISSDLDGMYVLALKVKDQVGNVGSDQINFRWDATAPAFSSLALGNVALDGFLNLSERGASQDLIGALTATGHDEVAYKLALAAEDCSTLSDYEETAPKANGDGFVGEGPYKVCVRLSDTTHAPAFGSSDTFILDSQIPAVSLDAAPVIYSGNVTAVALSGTCSEDGLPVNIGGGVTATATCSGGTWNTSLNYGAAPEGNVSLTVNHSDAAGNPANQITGFMFKDTVLPTVTIGTLPYINTNNASAVAVSGTCSENGRTVTIGGAVASTASCTGGSWNAVIDYSSVAQGSVSITVDISDAAGNNAVQTTSNLSKDIDIPSVTIAALPYIYNGNKTAVPVSGTCSESGRAVTIGGAVSASTNCVSGAWSATIDYSGVGDGNVAITADHRDAAGNDASQASASFDKDTLAPTVTLDSLPVINGGNVTSVTISGTCSEDGRGIDIGGALSGSATCSGGSWSTALDYSGVSDGSVAITADHLDAAGNSASQASGSMTKDTVLPTISLNAASANIANLTTVPVAGNCSEDGRTVTISGAVSGTTTCSGGSYSVNFDFTSANEGSITVRADINDAAGNDAVQAVTTFTKDTVAPTISISNLGDIYPSLAASFAVGGACSVNGESVSIGGTLQASAPCTGNAWSATLDYSGEADGPIVITADLTDEAGNPATQAVRNITKYATDPICGGTGDSCYDDTVAKNVGVAQTPLGKNIEYVTASGSFKVWKEVGGNRILKANGSDNWQMKLNSSGKSYSSTSFTIYITLVGRACPPHVYLSDSQKFTTGNCLYYDAVTSVSSAGLSSWSTGKWFAGNNATCGGKGMRLPTIYETSNTVSTHANYPSDGTPVFAGTAGVPSDGFDFVWTATSCTLNTTYYWLWRNNTHGYWINNNTNGRRRCVLP